MSSIKHEKVSYISYSIVRIMRAITRKTGKEIWNIDLLTRNKEFVVPLFIKKQFNIKHDYVKNHSVVTVINKKVSTNKHVIYLHGGGYITKGVLPHWVFIDKTISNTKCKVTYIDYPLAPKYGYKEIQEMVIEAYEKLVKEYPKDEFILMGDSAGGGLALTLAQSLIKKESMKQAIKVIMFSPWVDLEMKNNKIPYFEKKDFTLLRKKLVKIAKYYAKGDSLDTPKISPVNGSFEGLCDMELYTGSSEILYPDCIKLHYRAVKAGVSIKTYVYQNMPHVWILMPCIEARRARKKVIESIKNIK